MSKKKDDEQVQDDTAETQAPATTPEPAAGDDPVVDEAVLELRDRMADLEVENAALKGEVADLQEALRATQPSTSRKGNPVAVSAYFDGYEQALRDTAHAADGTQYVGRGGQTLSQALHAAHEQREARMAEAKADRKAASK